MRPPSVYTLATTALWATPPASAVHQCNSVSTPVSEPVKPVFDVEVALNDAVILFDPSKPQAGKLDSDTTALQRERRDQDVAAPVVDVWLVGNNENRACMSLRSAKVTRSTALTLALPRIVMTVTKFSGVNERCESVTTGETFNDLFKVEAVATIEIDGKLLYNKPDLPIQCYSFDESQKWFVAPVHASATSRAALTPPKTGVRFSSFQSAQRPPEAPERQEGFFVRGLGGN
ncbi:hypothetical protein BKA62DRAFT_797528 [Auriculariales sp. MPI-PUGE-AT-0066]|nr:hypothetical protein BKA62DRAFT_797528 [Auriculariales sp. MPI-PUGE-AT-0066]